MMLAMKIEEVTDQITLMETLRPELKPLSGTCNKSSVNLTPRDNVSRHKGEYFFPIPQYNQHKCEDFKVLMQKAIN